MLIAGIQKLLLEPSKLQAGWLWTLISAPKVDVQIDGLGTFKAKPFERSCASVVNGQAMNLLDTSTKSNTQSVWIFIPV